MWHTSSCRIVYDPYRGGMTRKTSRWCVAEVDREITRYYRYQVLKRYGIALYPPSWDAHISIVRGERFSQQNLWKKYHCMTLDFDYHHMPIQAKHDDGSLKHYWFVEVDAPHLIFIRKELNLLHDRKLHITIGRTYDHQVVK